MGWAAGAVACPLRNAHRPAPAAAPTIYRARACGLAPPAQRLIVDCAYLRHNNFTQVLRLGRASLRRRQRRWGALLSRRRLVQPRAQRLHATRSEPHPLAAPGLHPAWSAHVVHVHLTLRQAFVAFTAPPPGLRQEHSQEHFSARFYAICTQVLLCDLYAITVADAHAHLTRSNARWNQPCARRAARSAPGRSTSAPAVRPPPPVGTECY